MCITRLPNMSREEFKDYWMNKHGPFFMENAGAMRAKKYVQSHTVDTPLNDGLRNSRCMRAEYDGVAEVWFESEENKGTKFYVSIPLQGMKEKKGIQKLQ